MKLFLSPDLHAHRRGRFLSSILDVEPLPEGRLPDNGFLLMGGEPFQDAGDQQQDYLAWARQPGRALLLLPPYKEGRLFTALDWEIGFASGQQMAADPDSLAHVVEQEVMFRLEGNDGSSDKAAGHLWADHSSHTRYWKAYANSGLVAATTLPLWSISLMNHANLVLAFLGWLNGQTGKVSAAKSTTVERDIKPVLMPQDNTIMVCCYGLAVTSAVQMSEAIRQCATPFLNVAEFNLPESFNRLKAQGFLGETGLTAEGLAYLQASNYWAFAEHLKGAA